MNNEQFDKHIKDLLGNLKAPEGAGDWGAFEQKLKEAELQDQQFEEVSRQMLSKYEAAYNADSWTELSDKLDQRSEKLHLWRLKAMEATILVLALLLFLRVDSVYQLHNGSEIDLENTEILTAVTETPTSATNILAQTSKSGYKLKSEQARKIAKTQKDDGGGIPKHPEISTLPSPPMTYVEPLNDVQSIPNREVALLKEIGLPEANFTYDYPVKRTPVMARLINVEPKVKKHISLTSQANIINTETSYISQSLGSRGELLSEWESVNSISPAITYDVRRDKLGFDIGTVVQKISVPAIDQNGYDPEIVLASMPVHMRYYFHANDRLEVYAKGGLRANVALLANYESSTANRAIESSVRRERWSDGFLKSLVLENANISFDYSVGLGLRTSLTEHFDFILETTLQKSTGPNKFGFDRKIDLQSTYGFMLGISYGF